MLQLDWAYGRQGGAKEGQGESRHGYGRPGGFGRAKYAAESKTPVPSNINYLLGVVQRTVRDRMRSALTMMLEPVPQGESR